MNELAQVIFQIHCRDLTQKEFIVKEAKRKAIKEKKRV